MMVATETQSRCRIYQTDIMQITGNERKHIYQGVSANSVTPNIVPRLRHYTLDIWWPEKKYSGLISYGFSCFRQTGGFCLCRHHEPMNCLLATVFYRLLVSCFFFRLFIWYGPGRLIPVDMWLPTNDVGVLHN